MQREIVVDQKKYLGRSNNSLDQSIGCSGAIISTDVIFESPQAIARSELDRNSIVILKFAWHESFLIHRIRDSFYLWPNGQTNCTHNFYFSLCQLKSHRPHALFASQFQFLQNVSNRVHIRLVFEPKRETSLLKYVDPPQKHLIKRNAKKFACVTDRSEACVRPVPSNARRVRERGNTNWLTVNIQQFHFTYFVCSGKREKCNCKMTESCSGDYTTMAKRQHT